jgi:hypothetical protein
VLSLGEQSNPNDGPNTQIKYRKYRRAANQIKSNGPPAKKKQIKSKPNTGPENPNGTKWRRAESPAIWRVNRFGPKIYAWHKSIIVDTLLTPTQDPGAIRSNVLLARLMRRMSVCEFGSVVRTY